MSRPRLSIAALLFASFAIVLALPGSPAAAITGGTPVAQADYDAKYPWLAYVEISEGNGGTWCDGTVIAPQWVLSSASCISPEFGGHSAADVDVFVGSVSVPAWQATGDIADQIVGDPTWAGGQHSDIGLIHLSAALDLPSYPTLATTALSAPQTATVFGWGPTAMGGGGQITPPLQQATLNVEPGGSAALDQIVAPEAANAPHGTCEDEGAPLVSADGGTLMGVATFPAGDCAGESDFADVSRYTDWISQVMSGTATPRDAISMSIASSSGSFTLAATAGQGDVQNPRIVEPDAIDPVAGVTLSTADQVDTISTYVLAGGTASSSGTFTPKPLTGTASFTATMGWPDAAERTFDGPVSVTAAGCESTSRSTAVPDRDVATSMAQDTARTAVEVTAAASSLGEPVCLLEVDYSLAPKALIPAAPRVAFATPGPSRSLRPVLRGRADADSTVTVYGGTRCEGAKVLDVPSSDLAAGAELPVAANATTTVSARSTRNGLTSPCSTAATFVNDRTAPRLSAHPTVVAETTLHRVSVPWLKPHATDAHLSGGVSCNRSSAAAVTVPSTIQVVCRAVDRAGNVGLGRFSIIARRPTSAGAVTLRPGHRAQVRAGGFRPGSTVVLYWGSSRLGTAKAAANGTVSLTRRLPQTADSAAAVRVYLQGADPHGRDLLRIFRVRAA